MSQRRTSLSIVCPAYQEEAVLPVFHAALSRVLDPLAKEFQVEVVYVDDGSSDGTLAALRQLAVTDPRVRYLSLSRNFGHQAALSAGLEHAQGEVVVSLDSDLQHPPELIPGLIDRWREGYQVVLTERQDPPATGWFKRTSSSWFYRVMGWLSDTPTTPAASDFRLMTRPAVDALVHMRETHRYLRGMVSWMGFRVTCVPFCAAERAAGQSHYTLRRMLRLAGDGLLSFSHVPLRLPLYASGALFLGALLHAFALLGCAACGVGVGSWLTQAIVWLLLILNGVVLGSVGVLGEYVGRVFEQVKQRPIYLLKEASPVSGLGRRDNVAA